MPDSLLPVSHNLATTDDIPWILSLAYERYGPFDPGGALLFLLQAIQSPTALVLKGESRSAFLIATTVAPSWYPKRFECHVAFLCTKPGAHWQGIKLLRQSVTWARARGCVRWRFHSETAHGVDALCRRVGAYADSPRYVIDL